VTDVLLFAGVAVLVAACAGVLVLRGPLARLHYVSVGSLGVALVAAAVIVDAGPSIIGLKAALIAVFWLVTSPVLSHVVARTVHQRDARRR
jgi:multicomponent Na+:H+ antiporter subunit G